jgi:hypothetical protein
MESTAATTDGEVNRVVELPDQLFGENGQATAFCAKTLERAPSILDVQLRFRNLRRNI